MFCIQDDAEEKKNEEEKLEIHNLMNTMIDLENELKTKDTRIKYLEAKIASKTQKLVSCKSISTQVSIKVAVIGRYSTAQKKIPGQYLTVH